MYSTRTYIASSARHDRVVFPHCHLCIHHKPPSSLPQRHCLEAGVMRGMRTMKRQAHRHVGVPDVIRCSHHAHETRERSAKRAGPGTLEPDDLHY